MVDPQDRGFKMILSILLLAFYSGMDVSGQFLRSGCLNFGRCEKIIRAVNYGDTLALRCFKSPDIERMVKNPDSIAMVIRPELVRASAERSSLFWMGYVGVAVGVGGSLQDTILSILSERSPNLWSDFYIGTSRAIGFALDVYLVNRSQDKDSVLSHLKDAPRFRWVHCGQDLGIRRWCAEVMPVLDSVVAWYSLSLNIDSLKRSIVAGPSLSNSTDSVFAKIREGSSINLDSMMLRTVHYSCVKGNIEACIQVKEYGAMFREGCEDALPPGILFRLSQADNDSVLDSAFHLLAHQGGREGLKGILFGVSVFDVLLGEEWRKYLANTPIVAEDRHWFPQVEMPPAFALWFYGDSVRSQRRAVELRIPKLLALTATEQMACLRDTTKAHCGEIRDFVRETSTWGGAESVKPFNFLIRPLTRKPPGWR